jgi:two-component system response regulator DctR
MADKEASGGLRAAVNALRYKDEGRWTVKALAEAAGCSANNMGSWLRGDHDIALGKIERLIERGCLSVLPVIFLTGHGDVPTAVAAVKRGAFDFVEKPFSNNALVDRVEQALAASAQALLQRRQHRERALRLAELTERERDVMALVVEGRPNKLIADALHISVRTVEVHRAHIFEKMGVKSAVELANRLRDHDGVAA